jgi:hypothetical protein
VEPRQAVDLCDDKPAEIPSDATNLSELAKVISQRIESSVSLVEIFGETLHDDVRQLLGR